MAAGEDGHQYCYCLGRIPRDPACRLPGAAAIRKLRRSSPVLRCSERRARSERDESLKDVRRLGVDGDASGFDVADNVRKQSEMSVVLIDGKSTGIAVAVRRERDGFADICRP